MNVYSTAWAWYWDTARAVWGWVAELVAAYPGVTLSAFLVVVAVSVFPVRVEPHAPR